MARQQPVRSNRILYGPSLSYQYQQSSALKLSFFGLKSIRDRQLIRLEAGANIIFHDRTTFVVPELAGTLYFTETKYAPYAKLEINPYTLTPKIGCSIYTILNIDLGYGMHFTPQQKMGLLKGFTASAGIYIPLNFHVN
ncbi:hypothetical protein [Taibaiella sp. KBW10]|uniref:hypothetical protein n=1 Tax=Taibaiella sp. KBW10 TaxID=2153357 RepID=UPI0011CEB59F|nr:hypothetical protein [Taibaiella sp. KBW10]